MVNIQSAVGRQCAGGGPVEGCYQNTLTKRLLYGVHRYYESSTFELAAVSATAHNGWRALRRENAVGRGHIESYGRSGGAAPSARRNLEEKLSCRRSQLEEAKPLNRTHERSTRVTCVLRELKRRFKRSGELPTWKHKPSNSNLPIKRVKISIFLDIARPPSRDPPPRDRLPGGLKNIWH
eukprot:1126459-Prorocentrum_minimum.AAC.1